MDVGADEDEEEDSVFTVVDVGADEDEEEDSVFAVDEDDEKN